jgi:hypothetical protein
MAHKLEVLKWHKSSSVRPITFYDISGFQKILNNNSPLVTSKSFAQAESTLSETNLHMQGTIIMTACTPCVQYQQKLSLTFAVSNITEISVLLTMRCNKKK